MGEGNLRRLKPISADPVVGSGANRQARRRPAPTEGKRTDETASPQEETPGAKQAQRSEGAAMAQGRRRC